MQKKCCHCTGARRLLLALYCLFLTGYSYGAPDPGGKRGVLAASVSSSMLPKKGQRVEITVTGQVKDDKGEGLPGVSVLLKGTTTGTATDAQGKYSLRVPDANG